MSDRGHLRALPSVDAVLRELGVVDLPRPIVVHLIRRTIGRFRKDASTGIDAAAVVAAVREAVESAQSQRIRRVINATGIVIHTNLGRSPLAAEAVELLTAVAGGYSNLEFDLEDGTRGSRAAYLEQALAVLCGAEAATVVNNCAAALVLILRHFTQRTSRQEVIISRGELVQIGGGFRVPDILAASGATLREVGTTNRTNADDYRQAVSERTAMILRVHRSNFVQSGFVQDAPADALAAIAREAGVLFVEDLGSGATFDTTTLGDTAGPEPTPQAAIRAGADLVCFSGDKLLGGPQAGIIAGDAQQVAALKKDPLFRALRCDKLALAALQVTVELLLSDQADRVPIRAMLGRDVASLRARAEPIVAALAGSGLQLAVVSDESKPGGGSLPTLSIASIAIAVRRTGSTAQRLLHELRVLPTPIIGHVAADRVLLDLRTVAPHQDAELIQGLSMLSDEAVR